VSPVRYKLDFYMPGDCILHSYRRETLKSYRVPHSSYRDIGKFEGQTIRVICGNLPCVGKCSMFTESCILFMEYDESSSSYKWFIHNINSFPCNVLNLSVRETSLHATRSVLEEAQRIKRE
jgi:hypothetical protein